MRKPRPRTQAILDKRKERTDTMRECVAPVHTTAPEPTNLRLRAFSVEVRPDVTTQEHLKYDFHAIRYLYANKIGDYRAVILTGEDDDPTMWVLSYSDPIYNPDEHYGVERFMYQVVGDSGNFSLSRYIVERHTEVPIHVLSELVRHGTRTHARLTPLLQAAIFQLITQLAVVVDQADRDPRA